VKVAGQSFNVQGNRLQGCVHFTLNINGQLLSLKLLDNKTKEGCALFLYSNIGVNISIKENVAPDVRDD
jgi:hypothetical protein